MSSQSLRRVELVRHVDWTLETGLEIGPLDAPLISKEEGNIKYLDYLSHDELLKRHSARRNQAKIVTPDYVVSGQSLTSSIKERFDFIIACHVIEHVPNMIGWLNDVQGLLNDEGVLFLAVPDKRYTFDILRQETSLSHILNDHLRREYSPDFEHVFEHFFMKRELSSREIWTGKFQEKLGNQRFTIEQAFSVARQKISDDGYVDVHCHVFTGESFKDIVQSLIRLGLIKYRIIGYQDVVRPYNEFLVTLEKC